jgi:hypothetical protein
LIVTLPDTGLTLTVLPATGAASAAGRRSGRGARRRRRSRVQQRAERLVGDLRDRQVGARVPVEVRSRHGVRRAGERDRRVAREACAGVAAQDVDGAGVRGDGEVGAAVAVEVGGFDPDRPGADGDRRARLLGEAVVRRPAQQHGHRAGGVAGHRQVGAPVAVEVGGDDARRARADRHRAALGREPAAPDPQQRSPPPGPAPRRR